MNGFSLHAAVRRGADERQALKQLCRYIARPALVNRRLQINAIGRVVLKLHAPELNPDELVWSPTKRTGVARRPLRRGKELQQRVSEQLHEIADDPALVRSLFGQPAVACISDCLVSTASHALAESGVINMHTHGN